MQCNLKLYQAPKLQYGKNQLIDSLAEYLSTLTQTSAYSVRVKDINLTMTVKVPTTITSSALEPLGKCPYTYATLTDASTGGKTYYFFITDVEHLSKTADRLYLVLDTLNTLSIINNAFKPENFTDKTYISRCHRDRFYKPDSWNPASAGTLCRHFYLNNVDGAAGVFQKSTADKVKTLDDTTGYNGSWYLVYNTTSTEGDNRPLKQYLVPDKAMSVYMPTTNPAAWYPSGIDSSKYFYILKSDNPNASISVNGVTYYIGQTVRVATGVDTINSKLGYWKTSQISGFCFYTDSSHSKMYFRILTDLKGYAVNYLKGVAQSPTFQQSYYAPATENAVVAASGSVEGITTGTNGIVFYKITKIRNSTVLYKNYTEKDIYDLGLSYTSIPEGQGMTLKTVAGFDEIPPTTTTLNMVIKLPYCPTPGTYDFANNKFTPNDTSALTEGYITVSEWDEESEEWVNVNKVCMEITADLLTSQLESLDLHQFTNVTLTPQMIGYEAERNQVLESKVYDSDFQYEELVYDSYSKAISPERLDLDNSVTAPTVTATYVQSNDMSSECAFKLETSTGVISTDAYDLLITSNRNNNVPIYTSDYLNYEVYGKQYDEKANSIQNRTNLINSIIGIAGSAGGYAASLNAGTSGINASIAATKSRDEADEADFQRWMTMDMSKKMRKGMVNVRLSNKTSFANQITDLQAQLASKKAQNTPMAQSLLVNSAIKAAQTAVSYWGTRDLQKNAMAQKEESLLHNAVSVSNANSMDIFNFYNGNKLLAIHWTVDPEVISKGAKYYHFNGYKLDEMDSPYLLEAGAEEPTRDYVNSRIWFNYLQCTPTVDEAVKIDNEIISDWMRQYQEGVTIYHMNTLSGVNTWDLDQEYENYETWIVEGV